jgi:CHAD domain-containing protein
VSRYRSLEGLHQLRVGSRRFRAALTAFRSFVEDGEYMEIRAETKRLASEMDAARDIDVFIEESFRCAEAASPRVSSSRAGEPRQRKLGAKRFKVLMRSRLQSGSGIEGPC